MQSKVKSDTERCNFCYYERERCLPRCTSLVFYDRWSLRQLRCDPRPPPTRNLHPFPPSLPPFILRFPLSFFSSLPRSQAAPSLHSLRLPRSLPRSQSPRSHFSSLLSSLPPSSLTPASLSWLARIFAGSLACFSLLLSVIPFLTRLLFRPSPFSLLQPSPYHTFLTTANSFQHPLFVS